MFEAKDDGAKASHGDARDSTVSTYCRDREPVLNVGDQIMDDVIFVLVHGMVGRICVVRRVSFRHYQNQAALSIACNIRIV
jgi:hypothetical protein